MKKEILFIIFSLLCRISHSQEIEIKQQPIDYKTYIDLVWKQNIAYAAEKLNLNIAEAELKAAKVFSDPTLSLEYADNDERNLQMGRSVSVGLSKTISFGKRSANIDLAKSEKALNEALLTDYFHHLRAEATLAYLEALKQSELYAVKKDSYYNIRCRLAEGDSIRFKLGKITEVDAIQSKLEADIACNDFLQAHAGLLNSYSSLGLWTGVFQQDRVYGPAGKLQVQERLFDAGQLLQTALANRADLAAALKNVDVAQKELKVVRRERKIDFDLSLGYNYNTEVRNEIAPAPQYNGLTVGIAVPLKFSNTNRGALLAAEFRKQQAELNYRQAELEVQSSVMQSLRQYQATLKQVKQYETGMLDNARRILNGKIYSYERGETSHLDVLVAQQTFDELREAYIEAVFSSLSALIELELNVGIWDIEM